MKNKTYTKKEFEKNLEIFFSLLKKNNFKKEDFLFNSKPYINGLFDILKKTEIICKINKKKPIKILDFGCGSGLTSFLLSKRNFIVNGIDIYDKEQEIQDIFKKKGEKKQQTLWNNLGNSSKNLKINFFNGNNIPYKDKEFDLIFAHAVIEHIPRQHLTSVLKEITRVLKTDGYFVIARTPNKYALTEFLAKTHDIKFSKKEIIKIFKNLNYKTIFYCKTDFFPEIGLGNDKIQKVLNTITPVTHLIDNLISKTPLEILSHHHFIILRKKI